MINIAIVEDDARDMERIKSCLKYVKEKDGINYTVAGFNDADHFLFASSFDFDLVFLDIQMPGIDGLETARKIRESNNLIGIVFVTNMRQLAVKGYEVNALDFILKPVNECDFYLKMKNILARLNFNKEGHFVIGAGDKRQSLSANSITYVDVEGHYVNYHIIGGAVGSEYGTLKAAEKKLSKYPFFARCNRYMLINLNHVDKIEGDEVFAGGKSFSVSRAEKKAFIQAYSDYITRGGGIDYEFFSFFGSILRNGGSACRRADVYISV